MKVEQVYTLTNTAMSEVLGESAVVAEDLSNVVDLGKQLLSAGQESVDNYVRKLHDQIGRMVFVDRVYGGRAPSVLMDGWEYGSILEKVAAELPEAEENEDWTLQDGTSYDPNIFTEPKIITKLFNGRVTFEIPVSTTEKQVKSAFQSAAQLNAFYSMIQTSIQNSMTIKMDALVMRTINNMIGECFYADMSGGTYTGAGGTHAINLLYAYNQKFSTSLTVADALVTPAFIRFASMTMANYIDRLKVMSTLFNIGGAERFTPADRLHVVMLSEFKNAAMSYLQSDTFHDEYTALPEAESVVYWQGSGTDYGFSSTSKIYVTTSGGHAIEAGGILGVMFDRDALGVSNLDRRVNTYYNPKASFWNEWHKFDAGYFNDLNENMVVFYIAA